MHISRQDAQNIVDEMKASIHRDVNIMDENGIIVASTNPVRQGQLHQGALRVIREGLRSLTIWQDKPEEGVQRGINLPILLNGQLEGVIGITGDPEEVAVFGDILKRVTEMMLENLSRREQVDLIEHAKSLFVENWLFSDEPDWQEMETRGRLLHLSIYGPYTVALLKTADPKPAGMVEMHSSLILRIVQTHLEQDPNHFCTVIRNRVLVLLYRTERQEAYARIRDICREMADFYGLAVSAGVSSRREDPMGLRRSYLEAKTAVAVAERSEPGTVLFYDQASPEFIAQSIPGSIRQDMRKIVFGACTAQEEELFTQTVRLYFEQDGDIRRCAEKLFIHRNTFQYRMDALCRRTGYDLRIPKDAVLLYLAVQ